MESDIDEASKSAFQDFYFSIYYYYYSTAFVFVVRQMKSDHGGKSLELVYAPEWR